MVSTPLGVVDLDWVLGELAIGGSFATEHAVHLARHHAIALVVDLRAEQRDDESVLRREGITLLHLPTPDRCAVALEQLDRGVGHVTAQIRRGRRVLIHCQYGIGRSALLSACVLLSLGWAPLEALERLKQRRPRVSPSPEQLQALIDWATRYASRAPVSWQLPRLEELGAIAWRHLNGPGSG